MNKPVWTILSLLIIISVGLSAKFYHGIAGDWVRNSVCGVFYVVFWCLFFSLLIRKAAAWKIAISVLIATCCLEFLQLWHPPFLQWLRSGFIGRTILGDWFSWSDFPYYFLGAGLGWLWLRWLKP